MIPYTGWECEVCRGGNPTSRNRCRKCGRKRTPTAVVKQFMRPQDKRKRALLGKRKTGNGHVRRAAK